MAQSQTLDHLDSQAQKLFLFLILLIKLTGITLSPWECSTLHHLSIEHMNESHKATKRDCKAPWQPEDNNVDKFLKAKRRAQAAMRELANL